MFRITIIAVGKMKNRQLAALADDFFGRLRRHGSLEVVELKDGDVESEGRRVLDALEKRRDAVVYALAEEGKTRNSVDFAGELGGLQGRPTVFVVGGAFGLSPEVKQGADYLLSLSPFTFTHEIARMLLAEQLYRAVSIHVGSGYHHT